MNSLTDRTVVVAGATGNVGPFVVRALLQREATVVAPSRSEQKLAALREQLRRDVGDSGLRRLHTVSGNLSAEAEATALRERIARQAGTPDAVVATVGDFVTTPTLLDTGAADLQRALDGYLISNLMIARTFAPALKQSGGTYVLLQGPLAFELYPEFDAHLISIATAAQHMLFRVLAQEFDHSPARVVELVIHALIRDGRTQPGSMVPAESVGDFAAYLVSGAGDEIHGQSIQLRSPQQLADIGLAA
jgi:NAD(P)-dependent dehydrogenase (short-subunit alcohol dehydrogenase family)